MFLFQKISITKMFRMKFSSPPPSLQTPLQISFSGLATELVAIKNYTSIRKSSFSTFTFSTFLLLISC